MNDSLEESKQNENKMKRLKSQNPVRKSLFLNKGKEECPNYHEDE